MHCISIQIQPEFSRDFDKTAFLERVRPVRSPAIELTEERGKLYITFDFFTEFPKKLWHELKTCLYQDADYGKVISAASIVICEDESGTTVLLLHHFNDEEKLDSLD